YAKMSVPPEHLRWALDKAPGQEHVLFPNFVRRFDLNDRQSAENQFELLLNSSSIRIQRRQTIKKAFRDFQLHRQVKFWAERKLKLKTTVTALQAGVVTHDMGIKQARISSQQLFSSSESELELMDDEGGSEGDLQDNEVIDAVKETEGREASVFREGTKRAGGLDERPTRVIRRRQTSNTENEQDCSTKVFGEKAPLQSISPAVTATGSAVASDPFQNDTSKPDDEVDVVTLAEVGAAFEVEDFTFTGSIDGLDIGQDFTSYFRNAVNGILFLRDQPTDLQDECFGQRYHDCLEKLKECILEPPEKEVQEALAVVRKWKDTYEFKFRKERHAGLARGALKNVVEQTEDSSFKELFRHGCARLSSVKTSPVSEADQTTATVPTSGSVFVRLCKDLSAPPKHPDLVAKHVQSLDIAFGEVSFAADLSKDTGDLCRLAIWSKRVADQLDQQYIGTDEVRIPFFQVVSTKCTFFQMRRVGTVSVAVQVGELDIVQDLPGLMLFDQQVFSWLLLEVAFSRLLQDIALAMKHVRLTPPTSYYRGLSTPSARKMPDRQK
ncbi:hypothetical protein BGZ99_001302, partial [Dissophora globulifera]